jgi:hypothetical protein
MKEFVGTPLKFLNGQVFRWDKIAASDKKDLILDNFAREHYIIKFNYLLN